jgi:hypothetical protein
MNDKGSSSPPKARWDFHLEETYKGLIVLSIEAIKMLALVNGGAAVAILAYLGNIAGHAPTVPQPDMIGPLAWFCAGLLAAAITFIVAYQTQLLLFQEESEKADGKSVRRHVRHEQGIMLGYLLLLFAAVAFGIGCITAASAMKKAGRSRAHVVHLTTRASHERLPGPDSSRISATNEA